METCEQPILAGFADESLCSAQASHASLRVLPGSDEARQMTVGSGRQCSMLLNESSPLGVFSKILLESLVWGNSMECCHVWRHWDTRFELSAFELRRWEQATTENGCSLLPTPTVPGGGRVNPEGTSITGRKPDGGKAQMDLGHAIKLELAPTPTKSMATEQDFVQANYHSSKRPKYNESKLSATPTIKGNYNRKGASQTSGDGLATQAKLSATPSARDWKNGKASPTTAERNSRPLNEQVINNIVSEDSGMLNPRFVEEYQGFPIDHTALKPSATPASRSRSTRSSRQSRKPKA